MPIAPPHQVPATSQLVFFGDSLTDSGNLSAASIGLIEEDLRLSLGGPTGEASNGPTYATYASDLLQVDAAYNYAVAGAEAVGSQTLGEFIEENSFSDQLLVPLDDPALQFDMNLAAQIFRFEADFTGQDLSTTTAVILIGANDYIAIDLTNPAAALIEAAQTMGNVVAATMAAAKSLVDEGVARVVICSLPSASFISDIAGSSLAFIALADTLFTLSNQTLEAAVNDLANSGAPVQFLDLTAVTQAIAEDPSSFGLIAPYGLTLTLGDAAELALYDEDQVAFWDDIHPSTATHGVIGAYTAYAIDNPAMAMTDGDDLVSGDASANLIFGYGGSDEVLASAGRDTIFGGIDADLLSGGGDSDQLSGGSGNDELRGGRGRDVLDGDEGNDLVLGGKGKDVLIDGLGDDILKGAANNDCFLFTDPALIGGQEGTFTDIIFGGTGKDTIYLALSSENYALYADDLMGDAPNDALNALGLTVKGVEYIVVVEGRAGLQILAGEEWYSSADLWGQV